MCLCFQHLIASLCCPCASHSGHWGSSWAVLESSHHRVQHPVVPKHPFLSLSEAWEEVRSRPALLGCIQNQRMGGHLAGDQGRLCSVSAVKEVQGVAGGGGGAACCKGEQGLVLLWLVLGSLGFTQSATETLYRARQMITGCWARGARQPGRSQSPGAHPRWQIQVVVILL